MVITAGIGICAYNEEKNIGLLLSKLLKQKVSKPFKIEEIIVVASGCTDRTNEIVKEYQKKDPRVRLIAEKTRSGKSHAVNILLKKIKSDIFIMENADTLPYNNDTINSILLPFLNEDVTMAAGRPVPTNSFDTTAGFVNNFIWETHHQVSLRSPKMSEIMAIRTNIVKEIPEDSVVDDASIEEAAGNVLKVYTPKSIVLNHGPETLGGIIKQRKRICIGLNYLIKTKGYTVSTMKSASVIFPFFDAIRVIKKKTKFGPSGYAKVMLAVLMEIYARMLAKIDFYIRNKNPYKWEMLDSTKKVR